MARVSRRLLALASVVSGALAGGVVGAGTDGVAPATGAPPTSAPLTTDASASRRRDTRAMGDLQVAEYVALP